MGDNTLWKFAQVHLPLNHTHAPRPRDRAAPGCNSAVTKPHLRNQSPTPAPPLIAVRCDMIFFGEVVLPVVGG